MASIVALFKQKKYRRVAVFLLVAACICIYLASWIEYVSWQSPSPVQTRLSQELENSLAQVQAFKNVIKIKHLEDERANATFLVVVRNSELQSMLHTLSQTEANFNRKYKYPYVFLNDEPFSDEFMQGAQTAVSTTCYFGVIPKEHWSIPKHIDQPLFRQKMYEMGHRRIPYGNMESYHHMIRYYSGLFYKHPYLQNFDYYWRVFPALTLL
jgi:hypothetical protein